MSAAMSELVHGGCEDRPVTARQVMEAIRPPLEGIGAVIHDAGVNPTHPVWEAVGYLSAGDCVALHPPHRHRASELWDCRRWGPRSRPMLRG